MVTRSGRNFGSPPVSPQPRSRANSQASDTASWTAPRRQHSSSTEEGDDDQSLSSLTSPPVTSPPVTSPGGTRKGRPSGRKNTDRTNVRGFQLWEQKLLAFDVEAAGGLQCVFTAKGGVTEFCDAQASTDEERANFYGKDWQHPQRSRIRGKLRRWYDSLPSGGYYKLLKQWQVTPAVFRSSEATPSVFSSPQATPSTSKPKATPSSKPKATTGKAKNTSFDLPFSFQSLAISSPKVLFSDNMSDIPISKL